MSSNGCITTAVLTATTVNVVGIFMGCSYINSSGQRIYGQYYPALTTGTPDTRLLLPRMLRMILIW
jgi:hypothetical protein